MSKQIDWCKEHLKGFCDDDGKTRLEKSNEIKKIYQEKYKEELKNCNIKTVYSIKEFSF